MRRSREKTFIVPTFRFGYPAPRRAAECVFPWSCVLPMASHGLQKRYSAPSRPGKGESRTSYRQAMPSVGVGSSGSTRCIRRGLALHQSYVRRAILVPNAFVAASSLKSEKYTILGIKMELQCNGKTQISACASTYFCRLRGRISSKLEPIRLTAPRPSPI